jgi:hypothetical protein
MDDNVERIISFDELYNLLTKLKEAQIDASLFKAAIDSDGYILLFDSSNESLFSIKNGKLYFTLSISSMH